MQSVLSSPETTTSRLSSSLETTLQALSRLHAATDRLRPLHQRNSPGLGAFQLVELDRLCAMLSLGAAALTRRLAEISEADGTADSRLERLWRVGSTPMPEPDELSDANALFDSQPRSLLATYRAACRALCTSLQEARHAADSTTAGLVSGLLQRLERQLWLLDASRDGVRVGLPTIDLFLSC